MTKLGAVMRFTDSKEELLTMIGLMHNMGTKGSAAATLLRTSIMRIIAPSNVASRTLSLLGATSEEMQGLMEDKALKGVLKRLDDAGFRAYDAQGNLRPMIDIFSDLGSILADWAGGWDKIGKNETAINVLETIFGLRGIVGATNIISALESAVQVRDELLGGAAEGYGEYGQKLME